jgi:hypothetical protein
MKELVSDNTKLDSKKRVALFEVGNLFGTPIGFLIWVYWLA